MLSGDVSGRNALLPYRARSFVLRADSASFRGGVRRLSEKRGENALYEMHELYSRGFTPKVRRSKSCESCSLIDVCLPEMPENRSVRDYVAENAEETG